MRNYLCKFCTVPCKKESLDGSRWTCKYCNTKYTIDLHGDDKYHFMELEEDASYIWEREKPDDRYLIRVDFIKDTTTVFRLCKINSLRTKLLELPYSFLKEKRVSRGNVWDIKQWLEYNLHQSNLPEVPPVNYNFKCRSCGQECENSNPRYGLYWHCKPCNATYYLNKEPPHTLSRTFMSCTRDANTNWALVIDHNKNTTNLSYAEDKSEVDVLHLDFAVSNVYAYNLLEWIKKKLVWL